MERFKLTERVRANEEFEKHFGVPFWKFEEVATLCAYYGYLLIDLVAFDDYLIETYSEYDGSMEDFIIEKFGKEANDLVDALLPD